MLGRSDAAGALAIFLKARSLLGEGGQYDLVDKDLDSVFLV